MGGAEGRPGGPTRRSLVSSGVQRAQWRSSRLLCTIYRARVLLSL